MPTLADAGDAMVFCYTSESFFNLAVEVEGGLVDEDVEACALEHSLDLGEHGLYMCHGLGERRSALTNGVELWAVADVPDRLDIKLVIARHDYSLVKGGVVEQDGERLLLPLGSQFTKKAYKVFGSVAPVLDLEEADAAFGCNGRYHRAEAHKQVRLAHG